jgi:hypothetical protein
MANLMILEVLRHSGVPTTHTNSSLLLNGMINALPHIAEARLALN